MLHDHKLLAFIVYQYIQNSPLGEEEAPHKINLESSFTRARNLSLAINYDAHAWIQNDIEILMMEKLYEKNCRNNLTQDELFDFQEKYPIFYQEFNRNTAKNITLNMLNLLDEQQTTYLKENASGYYR